MIDRHLTVLRHLRKCTVCKKTFLYEGPPLRVSEGYLYVKDHGMCFECGYWSGFINKGLENVQIANGVVYKIMPYIEAPPIYMTLGGNGKTRYFVTKDLHAYKSNDVWLIGTVPLMFRDRLKDTGWFCEKSVYRKISLFNKTCNERGCFDRYKCFRFNYALEKEKGAFNCVPDDWVDGGEHCRYFVNTDLIFNYNSDRNGNKTKLGKEDGAGER